MAKTYDCFSFFNELDLLEIRLNELDSIVDTFVLVEATRTFQNKEKPLYFENNKQRFEKFLPKIKHVVVNDYPGFFRRFRKPTAWDFERNQRDHVSWGLKDCSPDDLIILSDIDEIPRPEKVLEFKNQKGLRVFEQKMYYYFLNCLVQDYDEPIPMVDGYKPWRGSIMLNYSDFTNFEDLRTSRNQSSTAKTLIPDGGWHYSWLGGVEAVLKKIEAYAHSEHNTSRHKDPAEIKRLITSGQDLFGKNVKTLISTLPEDSPKYILKNKDKFKSFILE